MAKMRVAQRFTVGAAVWMAACAGGCGGSSTAQTTAATAPAVPLPAASGAANVDWSRKRELAPTLD